MSALGHSRPGPAGRRSSQYFYECTGCGTKLQPKCGKRVIQAPKLEPRIKRYELTDYEWAAIKPMLPNKPARRSARK
jgi:hypothetical protein